jgi:hypothetical protein
MLNLHQGQNIIYIFKRVYLGIWKLVWALWASLSKLDENDERNKGQIKYNWLKSEKSKHVMMWSILLRMVRPAQVNCSGKVVRVLRVLRVLRLLRRVD